MKFLQLSKASAVLVLLTGCGLSNMIKKSKDQQLAVIPSPLELHGDSVSFTLTATLPKGLLKKNKIYSLVHTYKYADQKLALDPLVFNAKNYPNSKKDVVKDQKKYAFAYTSAAMDRGELLVRGEASNINGKKKATGELPQAKALITTSQFVRSYAAPLFVTSGYTNAEEYDPTILDFYFQQGSSKLEAKQVKGRTGTFLDNFIASKNVTKTVTIVGSHSPEGREAKNISLSSDRANAIKKYYSGRLTKFNYKKTAPQIQFITKSLIEDWRPFLDTIAAFPGFSDAEKGEITAIVNAETGTFLEKEAKLQALATYPKLFVEVYPKLRLAQTEILTIRPKKSDAEIILLSQEYIKGTAAKNSLTDKELAYAAQINPIYAEKELLYQAAIKQNDMWESHNNLGALYIEQAQKNADQKAALLDKAKIQFSIANNKNANAKSVVNGAIILFEQNSFDQASTELEKAKGLSPDAETVSSISTLEGVYFIRKGKYKEAISKLTGATPTFNSLYNLGLAYLLSKDFSGAQSTLEQAAQLQPQSAATNYLQAAVAARTGSVEATADNLQKAVTKDPGFKAKAISDVEFDQLRDKTLFKNVLR